MAGSKKKSKLGLSKGSFSGPAPTNDDSHDDDIDEFLYDTKNEQLILGQAFNSEICLSTFIESVSWDEFQAGNHKVIAFCILRAAEEDVQITDDIFDVYRHEFPGEEKGTGGLGYIAKLRSGYDEKLTKKSYLVFIKKLKTDSVKVQIQNNYVKRYLKLARDPSASLADINELSMEIDTMVSQTSEFEKRGFKTIAEINKLHDEEVKRRSKSSSFGTTGFLFLDKHMTEAFARKRVSVVAGRPGMGKSAFVDNAMIRLANRKNPVVSALYAMEMDSISTTDRFNAIETDIPLRKLIRERHTLTPDELRAERRVKKRREKKGIHICDDVRKSLPQIRRELKKLIEQEGVEVCFIDLFMKLEKLKGMRHKTTADQYNEMLNEVQRIARELDVHICVVVQIQRRAEYRNDKRPTIADLKDAGGFEEVADLILLFYREAYYLSKSVEDDFDIDIVEINIAKQRQGKTCVVKALFQGETTKIKKCRKEDIEEFDKLVATMKPKESKKKFTNAG
jgi:replicative DNA helicase